MKFCIGDYVRWRISGKVAKIIAIDTIDWADPEWPPETVFYFLEVHPDDNPMLNEDLPGKMVALEPVDIADSAPPDDPYGFDKIIT